MIYKIGIICKTGIISQLSYESEIIIISFNLNNKKSTFSKKWVNVLILFLYQIK